MTSTDQENGRAAPNNIIARSLKDRAGLTPRERLILAQILQGLSSKEIARELDISPRTVEFHRANLLGKYGARNTAELVRKVMIDTAV